MQTLPVPGSRSEVNVANLMTRKMETGSIARGSADGYEIDPDETEDEIDMVRDVNDEDDDETIARVPMAKEAVVESWAAPLLTGTEKVVSRTSWRKRSFGWQRPRHDPALGDLYYCRSSAARRSPP